MSVSAAACTRPMLGTAGAFRYKYMSGKSVFTNTLMPNSSFGSFQIMEMLGELPMYLSIRTLAKVAGRTNSQDAGLDSSSLCASEGNVTLETTFLDNCKEDPCQSPSSSWGEVDFAIHRRSALSLTVKCMIIPTGRGTYLELELPRTAH